MRNLTTAAREVLAQVIRSSPRIRGLGRASLLINEAFLKLGADPNVLCPMRMGHRLHLDARVQAHAFAIYSGRYDDRKINYLIRHAKPGQQILDIGANIGFYTVPLALAARRIGASVAAFEPFEGNCERLRENLRINGIEDSVKVFNFGLSSAPSKAKLALREDFLSGSDIGNASIAEDLSDSQFRCVDVELKRLDDLSPDATFAPISAIKLDIEGHEDRFLIGAAETLKTHRPVIAMEVNRFFYERRNLDFDRLIPSLLPEGYVFFDVAGRRPRPIRTLADIAFGDALLVPRERVSEAD